jgi:CRP-like cAMP-binding protein
MHFLRNIPIFSDIEESELLQIARVGVRKNYKRGGSMVLVEEEIGTALFVIISGKVKVIRSDDDCTILRLLPVHIPFRIYFSNRQHGMDYQTDYISNSAAVFFGDN